jgi:hypothetical protein
MMFRSDRASLLTMPSADDEDALLLGSLVLYPLGLQQRTLNFVGITAAALAVA